MPLSKLDDYFPDWKEREALAEAMIPLIGKLYRENIVVYCFGRALYNQSVTQLMKTHRYVRQVAQNELSEFETFPILQAIAGLNLGPCHIDLGKLASKYMDVGSLLSQVLKNSPQRVPERDWVVSSSHCITPRRRPVRVWTYWTPAGPPVD